MATFFTSDQHFGHGNIIEYCQRPFATVVEMDEAMIGCWNAVVDPSDIVFHLGDFTLSGESEAVLYFEQLNGRIFILSNPWHHDKYWLKSIPIDLYKSKIKFLPPMHVYEYTPPIVLCHYPLAVWDRKHYGSWHLHGHSHGRYKDVGFIMDVGVDANGFTPVSIYEVKNYMENLKNG